MKEEIAEKRFKTEMIPGEDGIVRARRQAEESSGLADAKALLADLAEIGKGKRVPLLVDLRHLSGFTFDREARKYLGGKETGEIILAFAFLVDSPLSKMLVNFFLGVNKPSFPTRMFTSEAKAIGWLKGFLD